MILLDRKKPISPLKLIHTFNYTETNRFCDIHVGHLEVIKTLDYTIGERIYNLRAGLYKIIFDDNEYIIDIYFDLNNGDFFIIKNLYDIKIYMAGSTPYNIIPYKINSTRGISSPLDIETVNDSIDVIIIGGNTDFVNSDGTAAKGSIQNPVDINRRLSINISTKSDSKSHSLNIPLKHSLGRLPNGARDYIVINTEQLIAHDIINTSKEVLSGGLNWQYEEDYSTSEYYVFFAEYSNVKLNNSEYSIRCSHFESVSCDTLLKISTEKNCIATSYGSYGNGIWIKIDASILDIHGNKDFGEEMKKWIISQAVSDNPIYIEYQISDTICNTILIDEYHAKTWYPITNITIDGNSGFSIFYKALKQL